MSLQPTDWRLGPATPHLADREVHVWRSSLDLPAEVQSTLETTLDREELERAARFATDQLRNRWVVGRGILRTLLGSYLDESPAALQFRYGEHEKPFLAGALAERGIDFNVSHSRSLALLAFARERQIGVDVEWIRDDLEQAEIASRFFSTTESGQLLDLPAAEQVERFFALWTCKEAFVKAQGGGITFGLSRFDVQLGAEAETVPIVSNEEEASFSPWYAIRFDPGPGFAGALAVEDRTADISLWDWASEIQLNS